ncbi:LysR family transcriptional regulator [Peptoniphilus equinus]|uniref:LysR family transcriptional regulator n=1 Tax=Peptoniphilus equinus TaxID=3016343 RepID=A0ABY7QV89_9FIRM|nr:LysR family transcriptional regulator [Peptoniphilus equinus]WBW50703.1 LysR family transcriptional regulator [Peptoniphilus equinus]
MEYVYEVYKERSFSKAAKNLFISQPSLSAAIKKVELSLGYEIFDRSTKPIGLTEFGQAYIKAVEEIKEVEENFENYLNDLGELRRGSISIGGTSLFISHALPDLMAKFSAKYPNVDLRIREYSTSELEERLAAGDLDLVIDNFPYDDVNYDATVYLRDNVILAVPSHYKINDVLHDKALSYESIISRQFLDESVDAVAIDLFKEYPFIFLKEGNDTRLKADTIFNDAGFKPNIAFELDQQITSFNMTLNGIGISFISDILVRSTGKNDKVTYYKIDDSFSTRNIAFYYKKNRYMKQATKEFLRMATTMQG